jgi:hypothetical protein
VRLLFRRGLTAREKLESRSWRCSICGIEHQGMLDLSVRCPSAWDGPDDYEPNGALRTDGNFLSEDFCVIGGEHFFVRGRFPIPVHGLDEPFGFGGWSTLSRRNFDLYLGGFDDGRYADPGPWPGYFSNQLDVFGNTLNQPCWVQHRPNRCRPLLTLHDGSHPLSVAQKRGITTDRVLEIYAAYGHVPE